MRGTWLGILVAITCWVGPSTASAQEVKFRWFRDRPYYEPLLAEQRPARNSLIVPAWSKEFPHSVKKGPRLAWQIDLGEEIPIVSGSNQVSAGKLEAGKWGVGLWFPVSFHMIEDFKDRSAPIVDTDYRFGFMTKAGYGFRENLRLGIRFVPWAHESTHLGDEYTIFAGADPKFERVNVSFEYWEYGVGLHGETWTLRHGGLRPWSKKGYFSARLLDSEDDVLTPSSANFEPNFGGEYLWPEWRGRHVYASVDARYRLVYNYRRAPQEDEIRQWSFNAHIGRTVPRDTTGTPLKQYFIQVYRGVNPYGQLRSQQHYWSVGLGWIFGM